MVGTERSEAKFAIKYDGPALENHTMNAKDLGPALLAISSLCQEANRVLTGENAEVEVQVKAAGEGSFEIGFELVQYVTAVAPLLLEKGRPTANDILELLGLSTHPGVSGLLGFLKWKKGRPIEKEESFSDDHGKKLSRVSTRGRDNTTIVNQGVINMFHDLLVRKAQRQLLAPLEADGITKFYIRDNKGQTSSEVDENEVVEGYFDVTPDEVGLTDKLSLPQEIEAFLILRAPVFKAEKKWQFVYGNQTIFALILDEKFNDKVFNKGERFGVSDRFLVKLCITQSLLPSGNIHNDYQITKVIKTIQGPNQQELPL